MWFTIKSKPSLIYGPRHYFRRIQLIKVLPKKVKEIVMENINRSAFHCHPENLLLSMLADDNIEVRVKAVEVIIKWRTSSEHPDKGNTSVRKFVVPDLNYNCKTYCDFKKEIIYEPNLTVDLTISELVNIKL